MMNMKKKWLFTNETRTLAFSNDFKDCLYSIYFVKYTRLIQIWNYLASYWYPDVNAPCYPYFISSIILWKKYSRYNLVVYFSFIDESFPFRIKIKVIIIRINYHLHNEHYVFYNFCYK